MQEQGKPSRDQSADAGELSEEMLEDLEFVIDDQETPEAQGPVHAPLSGDGDPPQLNGLFTTTTAELAELGQTGEPTGGRPQPEAEIEENLVGGNLFDQLEALEKLERESQDASGDVEGAAAPPLEQSALPDPPQERDPHLEGFQPEAEGDRVFPVGGESPDQEASRSRSRRQRRFAVPMIAAAALLLVGAAFVTTSSLLKPVLAPERPARVAARNPAPGAPLAGAAARTERTAPLEIFAEAPESPTEPDQTPADSTGAETWAADRTATETARVEEPSPDLEALFENDGEQAVHGTPIGKKPLIASAGTPPRNTAHASDEVKELEQLPLDRTEIIVSLKNGNTFQGELKSVSEQAIVLRIYNGEITLGTEILDAILPPESPEYRPVNSFPGGFVEFGNGNRMYGRIVLMNESRVIMDLSGARLVFPRPAVEVDLRDLSLVRPVSD